LFLCFYFNSFFCVFSAITNIILEYTHGYAYHRLGTAALEPLVAGTDSIEM
jgi:hypothetical protein